MSEINFKVYLFLMALLSSIYLPFIKIGDISLYGNTILSIILIPIIFYRKIYLDKYILMVLLMVICVIISSLYSNAMGITSNTYRNYIEAVKYAQFIPYMILSKYLVDKSYENTANFCLFSITFIFISVFMIEYFNILGLTESLARFYLGGNSVHLINVLAGRRYTITATDPNQGGAIALFLLFYQLVYFNFKHKKLSLVLALILLFIVLSTQSRTALLAMLVCGLITLIMSNNLNLWHKFLILILLGSTIYLLYEFLDIEYIKVGFQLLQEGENHSVNTRIDNSEHGLALFEKSPIFGVGPGKNELSTIIDSEYVLIFQRYGLVGIIVFSFFILNMLLTGFRARRTTFGLILFIYTLITLFVMTTNNAYSGYQLMAISIFLIISLQISRKLNQR